MKLIVSIPVSNKKISKPINAMILPAGSPNSLAEFKIKMIKAKT